MSSKKVLLLPSFRTIGVTEESDGKVVLIRFNLAPEDCVSQSPDVQKLLRLTLTEKEEVERYLHLDSASKKIIQAFVVANNTLYFNDNSDYQAALWEICSILHPEGYPKQEDNLNKPQYIETSAHFWA